MRNTTIMITLFALALATWAGLLFYMNQQYPHMANRVLFLDRRSDVEAGQRAARSPELSEAMRYGLPSIFRVKFPMPELISNTRSPRKEASTTQQALR